MTKEEVHKYSDRITCISEPKVFMTLVPSWPGCSDQIVEVWYCPECGNHEQRDLVLEEVDEL